MLRMCTNRRVIVVWTLPFFWKAPLEAEPTLSWRHFLSCVLATTVSPSPTLHLLGKLRASG